MPASLLMQFSGCNNLEGSISLSLRQEHAPLVSTTIDWISRDDHSWVMEGVSSFGATLFRIAYDASDRSFKSSGQIADRLDLNVHESGYLIVNGFRVAIRPEELPCLLKMRWPQSWLVDIQMIQPGEMSEGWGFYVLQDDRSILLAFDRPYEPYSPAKVKLQWQSFAGLIRYSLEASRKKSELLISGYNDYEVYIKDLEWP
jgi:hypothetical protein